MPAKRPYARIAITLPPGDLRDADKLAKRLDRSRSWVIAEALRRYVLEEEEERTGRRLDLYRRLQLARDLALTPEERAAASDEGHSIAVRVVAENPQGPLSYPSYAAYRAARRGNGS
jgi:hypothetical protein